MAHNQQTPPDIVRFKQILKANSLKATPQRIAVHEAMLELVHASADMVAENIISKGQVKVTIASVYNILSRLALMGLYKHRMSSNNKMYFDVHTYRHIHLYDAYNHEHKDVVDDSLLELIDAHMKRKSFRGYKVDAVDVQIVCHPSHKKPLTSY